MPCAVLVDWLLWPPSARPARRVLPAVLAVPAAYLLYVLLRGAATDWYPYPFLDATRAGGAGVVAGYAIAIAAAFLLVGWLLLRIGNRSATAR